MELYKTQNSREFDILNSVSIFLSDDGGGRFLRNFPSYRRLYGYTSQRRNTNPVNFYVHSIHALYSRHSMLVCKSLGV